MTLWHGHDMRVAVYRSRLTVLRWAILSLGQNGCCQSQRGGAFPGDVGLGGGFEAEACRQQVQCQEAGRMAKRPWQRFPAIVGRHLFANLQGGRQLRRERCFRYIAELRPDLENIHVQVCQHAAGGR